jgi:hypothetical protein
MITMPVSGRFSEENNFATFFTMIYLAGLHTGKKNVKYCNPYVNYLMYTPKGKPLTPFQN